MSQAPPTFTPDSEFAELETPRGPKAGCLSITALARFEFEAGKGNEGTKIMMVEWEDDDITRSATEGSWHVSWSGKTTVLPADERPNDSTRRFYLLLPPNVTIPPVITLSYEPSADKNVDTTPSSKARETLQLNPLPAIFPPELGATGRAAGKKGVLHTIWAKKRLRVLEAEIRDEAENNSEGVALHMAVQEKEWIEENFGVTPQGVDLATSHDSSNSGSMYPTGPTTPVSPVSGRKLSDKLKGLKLQTSEKDLTSNSNSNPGSLLSPQSPDVAVSSFSSFKNTVSKPLHSMPTPDTNTTPTPNIQTNPVGAEPLRAVAQFPPESIQEFQQSNEPSGFASLDSMAPLVRTTSTESTGDDLFAKALSPRSPDLPRSPFSFA